MMNTNQKIGKQNYVAQREMGNIFNIISDAITIHDRDFNIIHANNAAIEILGLKLNRILSQKCYRSYHGTDCPPELCPSCCVIKTGLPASTEVFEPNLNKHIEIRAFPRFDKENKLIGLVHIVRDISKRRKMEEDLKETVKSLKNRTDELQESVSAFKFLLKQRENDKRELEKHISANVKNLISPALRRLKKKTPLSEDRSLLKSLEFHLKEMVSPFTHMLSTKYLDLTQRELEIATLIKDGLHDKDIAEILGISSDTIKAHRRNIRRKLGIYSTRTNLRTHLKSL
jgi:DNA-binding NarL/FixJ family response regulator